MNLTVEYTHPKKFDSGAYGIRELFTKVENFGITKDDYLWVKHHGISETRPMLGIEYIKLDSITPFNWEIYSDGEIQPTPN